jgi:signal transduction histidine kinase
MERLEATALPAGLPRSVTVLAVDDDPTILEGLERQVDRDQHPYRYRCVSSCSDAIAALDDPTLVAVIADYVLPDGFGTDLVAFARGLPVIVMTGQGSEHVAVQALRAGACDYLIKDADGGFVQLVPATVERVLAQRAAEQAERQRAAELVQSMRENRELEHYARMIANVLATPLQVVQHYCGLLLSNGTIAKDRMLSNYARAGLEGARRAGQLVTEALDLSRVSSVGRPFAEVDLSLVFVDALREVAAQFPLRDGAVRSGSLPVIVGDGQQLRMLFQRLIARAVRRCEDGVEVEVNVSVQRARNEWLFGVEDPGGPADPGERAAVSFGVGDDKTTAPSLDVAICRRIVERHGGSLWFGKADTGRHTAFFRLADGLVPTPVPGATS